MKVPPGQATIMIFIDKKLKEKLKTKSYRDNVTVSVALRDLVQQYVSGQIILQEKED